METTDTSGSTIESTEVFVTSEPNSTVDAATVIAADRNLSRIAEPIRTLLAKPQPAETSLAEIAAGLKLVIPGAHAAAFFAGPESASNPLPGSSLFCGEIDPSVSAQWAATLRQIASQAISQKSFSSGIIRSGSSSLMAVATPITALGEIVGGFGLIGEAHASRELARTTNIIVCEVGHWHERCLTASSTDQGRLSPGGTRFNATNKTPASAQVHDDTHDRHSVTVDQAAEHHDVPHGLLTQLINQPDLESAAKTVAEFIARRFGYDRVFIGCGTRRGSSRLLAISGVPTYSAKSPLALAAEETLSEALIRNHSASADTCVKSDLVTSGCRELARLCNVPLIDSGPIGIENQAPWGAWVGARCSSESDNGSVDARERIFKSIAPCMQLFDRARGGRLSIAYRRCRDTLKTKTGMLGLIALATCAMFIPWPYHVKCDCELQPVTRRFIPVPYDGVLQEVFAEPGDEVKAGQVLARMDGREIEWELAAVKADYSQAAKQHDSDLAARDAAAAQVARLEMERLKVQMELLRDRLRNLEIKSPLDGVIIGGDPQKKEGARLAQGDSLFEAGPLTNMVAEIFVPDDEVSRVDVNQKASLRLDAFPSRKWTGNLIRISPSAELRDLENVFVAELEIENPQHVLRPGMRGRSRISTGIRPLGWNLFHKAWEQLVYGWGW